MAAYKLIQDIEAEDKIIGPLTLRQFIFALIGAFFGYLSFMVVSKGVAFLLIIFLPPTIFCALFAFPFGKDQPTEIWLLAKIRFWFFPRKRLWDQTGVKELVTITVPRKVEQVLTDGLSQTEVKSRLQGLANTLDSRGWAIKNIGAMGQPATVTVGADRLIDLNSVPQDVPSYDIAPSSDILDTINNPIAQHVDAMVHQSAQAHRQKLINEMNSVSISDNASAGGGWFMGKDTALPSQGVAPISQTPPPLPPSSPISDDEKKLSEELKQKAGSRQTAYQHMRTLEPGGSNNTPVQQAPVNKPGDTPDALPANDQAIMSLAHNDDLNVATLARQAHKTKGDDESPNEVVISLH